MLKPPYTVSPCHKGRGKTARIDGYLIHDADGILPVAHVYNPADNNKDLKETATVFAAAPELLEALEAAQWHLMGKARKDPTEQEIVYQITAAIAKARGQ